jgi:1-phosphofructokinase family hexose kinase
MIVTVTPNPVLDRTLTVPRIAFNAMVRAIGVREDWGGKGFNVSRALHALGEESVVMGFVGGATGDKLLQGLSSLGIAADLTPIAGETRTNIVITDTAGDRYVKVNEVGPTIRDEELASFFRRVEERAAPGDIWALCGSLPPGVPPDFYAELIQLLRSREVRVVLDTSGPPFDLGMAAHPYLVKPNAAEAEAATGCAAATVDGAASAAASLLDRGMAVVALSLGAGGLLLASEQARVLARPPTVRAPNPVGAGDALVAGMIWAMTQGLDVPDVARWGVAAGTAAAMREGVSVGTRAEVEAIARQVTVLPWPEAAGQEDG